MIVKEELDSTDKDDTGNLEDLLRIVFIHEECGNLNPIQDGLFRGCSRMGGGGGEKWPPSLKSVTHILQ